MIATHSLQKPLFVKNTDTYTQLLTATQKKTYVHSRYHFCMNSASAIISGLTEKIPADVEHITMSAET